MIGEEALKGLIKERDLEKANRDIWDEEEDRIRSDRYVEMLNIAIKALEQKPCEDCISRQAFIERFREWTYSEFGRKPDNDALSIRVAMSLSSVTPQPKTGHWIHHKEIPFKCVEHWECSECHRTVKTYPFIVKTSDDIPNDYYAMYFCPKCGAKMKINDISN